MREDAAKALFADMAGTDVGVTVEVRIKGTFGIVGVDDLHQIKAQSLFRGGYGLREARYGSYVVAGRQQMAGIETVPEGQISFPGGQIADETQFFETTANLIA